jgi:hypothetical protein
MPESALSEEIAAKYLKFAQNEARGRSPLYEEFALGIANDDTVLRFLAELPPAKRQPNLLFASVRKVCGTPTGWDDFRQCLNLRCEEIRAVMLTHSTQTNEPARCATLLPLLALLPQPLALVEVGASAGLCLLPDRYAYRFNQTNVEPRSTVGLPAPCFHCTVNAATPTPQTNIEVVWRMGLDLEPLNVRDHEHAAWLETLVWPGEESRLTNLRQALEIARADPPTIVRGKLQTDLPALMSQAPRDATLVIFHSAVLAYVPSERERMEFAATVERTHAVWIGNESPGVTPGTPGRESTRCLPGEFLLSRNGREIAATDPHGRSLRWFEEGALGEYQAS